MEVLPIFKSHYSIGRSILTLEDEKAEEFYPNSIINIAKENKLKEVYLVEDNMTSFLEAYTNTKKYNISLRYGVRISVNDDLNEKSEESRKKTSKAIIFFKNNNGYKSLINIFTIACKQGFYYEPRIDYKTLRSLWKEDDLLLCIPFYDSFIFNNTLMGSICVPDFSFTNPLFFIENNSLPFDNLIKSKVNNFAKANSFNTINVKSVFYKNRKDFKAYLTFRCINNRTNLNKPELAHMTSNSFCYESIKA